MSGIKARLQRLREAGGPQYDGPGFRFIAGLVQRADDLEGSAGERLLVRAGTRLDTFEEALAAARAEAKVTLQTLEAAEADRDGVFAAAFNEGNYKFVLRAAPRALRRAQIDDRDVVGARAVRLAREARARGLPLAPNVRARIDDLEDAADPMPEDRAIGDQIARALFRDAAEHARSVLVIARATDALPEDVGPYNPQALGARALALVESLSPAYLRSFLTSLDDLATLRGLPAPRRRRR